MRKSMMKHSGILVSGIALSLLVSCGSSVETDKSEVDAIAKSAEKCGTSRLRTGLDKENVVTVDLGSRLTVRAVPNGSAAIVAYLSYQSSVFIKSINENSTGFVEIYPGVGLKCVTVGCEGRALYVDQKYLEPVNYPAMCVGGSSSLGATSAAYQTSMSTSSQNSYGSSNYKLAISTYSNGQPVKGMIRYADANREPAATGMCLRYVKNAMLTGGRFFSSYPGEVAARKFGPYMENVKFQNILEIPEYRTSIQTSMKNIPVGCIAVYTYININGDKNAKYGHIEIRTANGFESDYASALPRTGSWTVTAARNRKLTGVYCKIK